MRPSLLLLAALLFGLPAFAGDTLDRVMSSRELNALTVSYYPPFGFLNDNNELDGFDVDVAKAVAGKLGVALKLSAPGWETIVSGHWRGRWDVCICSMSPTADRAKVLDFPVVYYNSPAFLIVNKNDITIKSIADISGKRVGVGQGSTYESYVNKALTLPGDKGLSFPFDHVSVVSGDETVNFQNLALGPGVRLDAVVSDLATAQRFMAATHALRIVGGALYAEPNAVATEKGDPEWNARIVRIIDELRQDGTLSSLSFKWFGMDIS